MLASRVLLSWFSLGLLCLSPASLPYWCNFVILGLVFNLLLSCIRARPSSQIQSNTEIWAFPAKYRKMQTKFNKSTLLSFVKATGTSKALCSWTTHSDKKHYRCTWNCNCKSHTDSVIEWVNEWPNTALYRRHSLCFCIEILGLGPIQAYKRRHSVFNGGLLEGHFLTRGTKLP